MIVRICKKILTAFGKASLLQTIMPNIKKTTIVYQQTDALPPNGIVYCNNSLRGDRLVYLAGVSNCFSTKYMRLNTPSHIWDAMH